MAVVEFKIGNKVVKKNQDSSGFHQKKFRAESLSKRTKAEIHAEEIIRSFGLSDHVSVEHVFQFRRFDFYFSLAKMAIEVDGGYHRTSFQREYDAKCDSYLYDRYRIKVFRVVNFDDTKLFGVLKQIKKIVDDKQSRMAPKNGDKLDRKENREKRKRRKERNHLAALKRQSELLAMNEKMRMAREKSKKVILRKKERVDEQL